MNPTKHHTLNPSSRNIDELSVASLPVDDQLEKTNSADHNISYLANHSKEPISVIVINEPLELTDTQLEEGPVPVEVATEAIKIIKRKKSRSKSRDKKRNTPSTPKTYLASSGAIDTDDGESAPSNRKGTKKTRKKKKTATSRTLNEGLESAGGEETQEEEELKTDNTNHAPPLSSARELLYTDRSVLNTEGNLLPSPSVRSQRNVHPQPPNRVPLRQRQARPPSPGSSNIYMDPRSQNYNSEPMRNGRRGGRDEEGRTGTQNSDTRSLNRASEVLGDFKNHLEATIYLTKAMLLFFMLSLGCLVYMILWNDVNRCSSGILILCYCYFALNFMYAYIRRKNFQRDEWRRREEIYYIIDAISSLIFIFFIQLNVTNVSTIYSVAALPFFANLVVYSLYSKATRAAKTVRVCIRAYYVIQTVFITMQLDQVYSWDWGLIFSPSWLYLAIIAIYFVAFFIVGILTTISLIWQQDVFENLGAKAHCYGNFWYLLYYGLSGIAFLGVIAACQILNGNNGSFLLRQVAIAGFAVNLFLLIFTPCAFKHLKDFVILFVVSDPPRVESDESAVIAERQRSQVGLEVERRSSFFVMLSATYFQPLSHHFLTKNRENLERVKTLFSSHRSMKSQTQKKQTNSKHDKLRHINIEMLKKDKVILDEKMKSSSKLNTPRKRAAKRQLSTIDTPNFERLDGDTSDEVNTKHHLSADNIVITRDCSSPLRVENRSPDEKLCYLCFDSVPNAILMRCRHGGICYECAVALVKKKNECMECRAPVESIYKIDPNPKMKDIVKGIEKTRVIKLDL